MPDEVDNLVLELLRAIRADTAAIRRQQVEHGHRLARLELGQAAMRRDQAGDAEASAHAGVRVDELADRLERVETRLGLRDA